MLLKLSVLYLACGSDGTDNELPNDGYTLFTDPVYPENFVT